MEYSRSEALNDIAEFLRRASVETVAEIWSKLSGTRSEVLHGELDIEFDEETT